MINRYFILWFVLMIPMVMQSQVVEKNYLSTDKDIYEPQDTVWFKGYVFDMNNVLSVQSIAYHVLMLDPDGNKLMETSWSINNGVTDGFFVAPKYEGRFKLVAVSGQMIGSPADQIFSKDIFVRSEIADEIEVLAFPQFEKIDINGENLVDIFTMFSTNNSAPEVKLTYQILSGEKRLKRGRLKSSEKGKVTLSLKGIKTEYSDLTLIIESQDKRLTKSVKLALEIPTTQQNIDLQFFPEGGEMINGMINKVAFKAIDEKGNPFNFKGMLLNSSGEVVGSAESYYQGMGALKLLPKTGEEYFFKVNSPYKIDSLFKLPLAKKSGISLSVSKTQKEGKKYAIVRASQDLFGKKGQLIISKNNEAINTLDFEFSKQENWEIAYENLDVGTYSFMVTNENQVPLAERLLFANVQEQLKVDILTNKEEYEAREKVETTITITDDKGNPVQGNFSVAAIDNERNQSPLPDQPNLLGQILLASELKGNVPTPNFYFTQDERAIEALDLVMMTNGWRKYSPSFIVDSEGLAGSLHKTNRNRKYLKNREVFLTALSGGNIESFEIDTSGIFKIPSSYLKAKGDSFLIFSERNDEKDKFSIRPNQAKRIQKDQALYGYLQGLSTSELKTDNSIYKKEYKLRPDRFQNTLLLNSVVVEANAALFTGNCELQNYHFEKPWVTKTREQLNLEEYDAKALIAQVSPLEISLASIGNTMFGKSELYGTWPMRVQINCVPIPIIDFKIFRTSSFARATRIRDVAGEKESATRNLQETLKNTNNTPRFFFPPPPPWTIERDYKFTETVNRIDLRNIESISVNTFTQIVSYTDHALNTFPIININTINDQVIYKPIFDMKFYHSIYQNYTKEFYAPTYETEKQRKNPVPDLRTTIFWQANVFTDENGQATINYHNADRSNPIKLTVEGVDVFSRIGFGTTTYQVLEGPETEEGNN